MVDLKIMNNKLIERGIGIIRSLTGVSRSKAKRLIDICDGEVKNAIVVQKLGVSYSESIILLDEHHGSLRAAIGE